MPRLLNLLIAGVAIVAGGCARAAVTSSAASSPSAAAETTYTVYLVRHAEKATDGSADPALSEAGASRARALRDSLRGAHVSAIFTSPYRRTHDTADPLAGALGVAPVSVALTSVAAHVSAVADSVRRHGGPGHAVLVVGHSNTIPDIISALGGPVLPPLCEQAYGDLFVLRFAASGAPSLERRRFGVPADTSGCGAMQAH